MTLGLTRPFQRDGKSGFAKSATDDDAVASRLEAIVASGGELPWAPELDSRVDRLRNRKLGPMLAQFAQVYVQEAVQRFEPAVTGVKVDAAQGADGSLNMTVNAQRNGQALPVVSVTL